MPGLFGVASTSGDEGRLVGRFGTMFDPSVIGFQHESLLDPGLRWALGRTHLGVLQPDPQLDGGDAVHVLFHGDLDNAAELAAAVPGSRGKPGAAGLLAHLYKENGTAFAGRASGSYCLAIVDAGRRRLILASDAVGSYPLYWTVVPNGLVFASELRAVLRHPSVRRELDADAVADYVTFGMPLGDRTLAADVHLLPPGSVLSYDWEGGTIDIRQVSTFSEAFVRWQGSERDYMDALRAAFRAAVHRSVSGDHGLGLSLSGGLDSRAILAALNGRARTLVTCTLGVKGCADEVIAAQLAEVAGTRHVFFELDDTYLHDFLPNLTKMVTLTDGMYLSHGLTEMLALQFLSSGDFSVLVRGHGGELAKTDLAWPLHTDDRVRSLRTTDELVSYLFSRANYITPILPLAEIFTEPWAQRMEGSARRSITQAVAHLPLGPEDLCSYLYLNEHHRRFTVASLELFRHVVEVRLPFVDAEFLRVLFRGAPAWRAGTTIHREVTKLGDPALLRIRNSNTGAAANAGPLTERVLDKMNSLFKRLNVSGYRHYHNFQAWMRERLLSSVETVLLSPASLDRGVLREAGVRRLLDDTRQNRTDHSYLLQVLLILELWQQENL